MFRYANRASGGAGELQTVHDLRVAAAVSTETGTIVYIIYLLVIYYIVLDLYCSIYHIYIYDYIFVKITKMILIY